MSHTPLQEHHTHAPYTPAEGSRTRMPYAPAKESRTCPLHPCRRITHTHAPHTPAEITHLCVASSSRLLVCSSRVTCLPCSTPPSRRFWFSPLKKPPPDLRAGCTDEKGGKRNHGLLLEPSVISVAVGVDGGRPHAATKAKICPTKAHVPKHTTTHQQALPTLPTNPITNKLSAC